MGGWGVGGLLRRVIKAVRETDDVALAERHSSLPPLGTCWVAPGPLVGPLGA